MRGRVIVRDLSFEVGKGTTLAIIGPNGSGKTVLLRAMLGQIPYDGRISWITGIRPAYIPQKLTFDPDLPLSARDLLMAQIRILRVQISEFSKIVETAGFPPELLQQPIGTLSGGQLQKLLIAFALIGNPTVLLCDEPASSLDEASERHIYDVLRELQQGKHLTVVLVSHDLSVVSQHADAVLCLGYGRWLFGPPGEVLTAENIQSLYGTTLRTHDHQHQEERQKAY